MEIRKIVGDTLNTAEEIRKALRQNYPDVDDDEFSMKHSGFIHEHPMTAIAVVLISSIVLGTTEVNKLAEFTGYSKRFIRTIAWNMENNRLREDGKYNCASWSSGNLLPRNRHEAGGGAVPNPQPIGTHGTGNNDAEQI